MRTSPLLICLSKDVYFSIISNRIITIKHQNLTHTQYMLSVGENPKSTGRAKNRTWNLFVDRYRHYPWVKLLSPKWVNNWNLENVFCCICRIQIYLKTSLFILDFTFCRNFNWIATVLKLILHRKITENTCINNNNNNNSHLVYKYISFTSR